MRLLAQVLSRANNPNAAMIWFLVEFSEPPMEPRCIRVYSKKTDVSLKVWFQTFQYLVDCQGITMEERRGGSLGTGIPILVNCHHFAWQHNTPGIARVP